MTGEKDIETWIERVINSCMTSNHRINANNLVKLYLKKILKEGVTHHQYINIRDNFDNLLLEKEQEELWDYYSGLPNPMWYQQTKK
jgi:hypothetical protein